MAKKYIIFYDKDRVVFPVKALLNPYEVDKGKTKLAFCAGSPQFFGGGDSAQKTALDSLQSEVLEESVVTYSIANEPLTLFHSGYYNDGRKNVPCDFYYTSEWEITGEKWPDEETWKSKAAKYREMCWVASLPKSDFSGVGNLNKWGIATLLLKLQPQNAPKWAVEQMIDFISADFGNSLTLDAFAEFLPDWVKGSLP